MIKFIKDKWKSGETKSILTLIGGTSFAQAIPLLSSLVLTRIYSPEHFGDYALFLSIVAPLGILSTFRFEYSIPASKSSINAMHYALLASIICVLLCLVLLFISFVIIFHLPFESYLVIIAVFFTGIFQIQSLILIRNKKFKNLTYSRIIQTLFGAIGSIGLGIIFKANALYLIFGYLSGLVFCNIYLVGQTKKYFKIRYKLKLLPKYFIKNKSYAIYLLPGHLLNIVFSNLPIYLFTYFYSASVVGFFSLAQRVVRTPSGVIASAFGDVFRQKSAEIYYKNHNYSKLFENFFKKLLIISSVAFMILGIFSVNIFEILFGKEWKDAGVYVMFLTPMYFFQFLTTPFTSSLIISGKQKYELIYNLIFVIITLIIIYFGAYYQLKIENVLLFYALSNSFVYFLYLKTCYNVSKG